MDWKDWIGKRIFVKLTDGGVYSGQVLDVNERFFFIKDKFGDDVCFLIDNISKLKEEKEYGN